MHYSVDIFLLKVIFCNLGKNEKELYGKINEGFLTFPEFISIDCRNFIRRILIVNPFERPTTEEVYFYNIDIKKSLDIVNIDIIFKNECSIYLI